MSAMSALLILNNTEQTEELVKTLSGIEAICHISITKSDIMLNTSHKSSLINQLLVLLQLNLSEKPCNREKSAKNAIKIPILH